MTSHERGLFMRRSSPWRRWRCTRALGHDWSGWRLSAAATGVEYRDCRRCHVRELAYPFMRRRNDKRWFIRRTLLGRVRSSYA